MQVDEHPIIIALLSRHHCDGAEADDIQREV
jgi:hypothetical protein